MLVWFIRMPQYEKTDVSEGIDASAPKEYILCDYRYLKNVGFKFKPHVCDKYHDVLMTASE